MGSEEDAAGANSAAEPEPRSEPRAGRPVRESLRMHLLAATQRLTEAGVSSPQADAELLAAHLLGVSRTKLGLHPLVTADWLEQYRELVDRRVSRVPLQHILGSAVVGGTEVSVGPGVFIPRPETESLVAWAVAAIRDIDAPLVIDLCSGSGVIALAIAQARPDASVYAVERSDSALAWARRNIERHQDAGGTPVQLLGGDFADPRLLVDLEGRADLVTANPPYVPAGTVVEPEVADHDPAEAVFAGPDGLEVIRPLISIAAGLLRLGGQLAIEHDDSHGESVPALLSARRVLADVTDHQDLAGRPRFVTARRVPLNPN